MHLHTKTYLYLIILNLYLFNTGCDRNWEPVSAVNQSWLTKYGSVTLVDSYPLYKMNYTADYKFDEYLKTGDFPNLAIINPNYEKFTCTCFSAFGDTSRVLGRNYDWDSKELYYLVFTDPPDGYASVSTVDLGFFNYKQNDVPTSENNKNVIRTLPYFPFDGMNERGLAVGMNALAHAESPYDPAKVTIGELQMIRLILDYAASTSEAISLIQQYNVRMEDPPVHYLVADSSGHSAIIEFVNGSMKVINNTNPWQVTTNFTITGANLQNPPCWRYSTATTTLEQNSGNLNETGALDLLQSVSVSGTRWSTVYNLKEGKFQIVLGRDWHTLNSYTINP